MAKKFDRAKAIAFKNAYLAEREANLARRGVCQHGVFVGGVMEDFMCHDCEAGWELTALRAYEWGIACAVSEENDRVAELVELLLMSGTSGWALRQIHKVINGHFGE